MSGQIESHTIPSPTSNVSDNLTTTQTPPSKIIGFFSRPASPPTSISSFGSFRLSHTALPRLRIPQDSSKMVVQTRGSKRKLHQEDQENEEQATDSSSRPTKQLKTETSHRDIGTQADEIVDVPDTHLLDIEAQLHDQFALTQQALAEMKEEKQEFFARVEAQKIKDNAILEEMTERLREVQEERARERKRIERYEALMLKYKIPQELWSS